MTYADELDDRDAACADMTALLAEDPADWPAAQHCPTHGWWVPRPHDLYCPACAAHDLDHAMRYDATIDHHHAHPEGP